MTPSVHTMTGPFGAVPVAVATCAEVQGLPHRALRVYLVLLARHNAKRDGWAWSLTALANDTGIARKKVPEAVHQLEQAGLVEVRSGGGMASTHYRVLVPPSMRVVPAVGTSTDVQSPPWGLPTTAGGTRVVPAMGTSVVPAVGTTRQRSHTDGTEDPPYPHTEGNPPSPPASRGEQAVEPSEEDEEPETRGDRVRQLARDMGIRPREARRIVERQEHIAADTRPKPPPLLVDMSMLAEMRARGWLSSEQEQAFGSESSQPVPETAPAQAVEVAPVDEPRVFELPARLAHRARHRATVDAS